LLNHDIGGVTKVGNHEIIWTYASAK